ncbi:MAG TPA: hypothetical protein VM639_02265 [Dongiaceae bacterium]|nr:hypothetical protein [Dongiaceae bacterium]
MFDRGRFWSPVPAWQQSSLERPDFRISAVRTAGPICLVSGNLGAFLTAQRLERCLGPRDICGAQRYALQLAPDRLLYVGDGASTGQPQLSFGWSEGIAVTDVSDGYLLFDVLGRSAVDIMRLGGAYDYDSLERAAEESAMTLFAGIKVALMRLETGWRLHVERPAATALWHWLEKAC